MSQFIWSPWKTAEQDPGRPAVISAHDRCDFGELTALADRLTNALLSAGVPEGATVGTDVPPGKHFFALALAVLRGGFRLLPISAAYEPEERSALLTDGGAVLDVTLRPVRRQDIPSMTVQELVELGSTPPDLTIANAAGALSYVTSGTSSGTPAVVAGRRPWYPYRGVAVQAKYAAGPEHGPHVMANATFHLGTVGPALYALQSGSAVVVQHQWSPQLFVDLVDEHRADSAFLAADHISDLVTAGVRPRHDLKVVFHGGSHCAPAVKRAAIELLGPVLHEYYGTSQGVISEITSAEWLRRPGSAGRAIPGVRAEIDSVVPGSPGEIVVTFRDVGRTGALVVRTGDLGRMDEYGYLYVLGRMEHSQQLELPLVENGIRAVQGVLEVVLVPGGKPGSVRCFAEVTTESEAVAGRVAAEITAQGFEVEHVQLRPAGYFPRTPTGKLRRSAVG